MKIYKNVCSTQNDNVLGMEKQLAGAGLITPLENCKFAQAGSVLTGAPT
jgi:hypothetical protein